MSQQQREAIAIMKADFVINEGRLYEHSARTFQWLMATLFAANGGAMIALIGDGAKNMPGREYALIWFAIGLVCSIVMGGLSTFQATRATKWMAEARLRAEDSLLSNFSPEKELRELILKMEPSWKTWFPSYAGVASFAFFVLGLATVAGSMLRATLAL